MKIKIEHINNANVYIDDRNLIGTVEEVSAPSLKFKKREIKGLGMFGVRKVKAAIEAMEISLKKVSINTEDIDTAGEVSGKIVGDILTKEGGINTVTKAVIFFKGESAEEIFGTAKAEEWSGQELKLDLHAVRYVVDGFTRLEIDIDNDIYLQNGKDMRLL